MKKALGDRGIEMKEKDGAVGIRDILSCTSIGEKIVRLLILVHFDCLNEQILHAILLKVTKGLHKKEKSIKEKNLASFALHANLCENARDMVRLAHI
jgi:hypothetical protein